jgi:hypothetical protein
MPQPSAYHQSSPITEDLNVAPLIKQYMDWLLMQYPKYIELFNAAKEGFTEEVYI